MAVIKDQRWAMGLGIRAGKALKDAEIALYDIQANGAYSDFNVIANLRAARCELNHLAKAISRIVDDLERGNG